MKARASFSQCSLRPVRLKLMITCTTQRPDLVDCSSISDKDDMIRQGRIQTYSLYRHLGFSTSRTTTCAYEKDYYDSYLG